MTLASSTESGKFEPLGGNAVLHGRAPLECAATPPGRCKGVLGRTNRVRILVIDSQSDASCPLRRPVILYMHATTERP
jgi:hypothetical protein